MRCVIHGEIYSSDFSNLNQLIADWSSAYRFSFCRFQKDKLSFNEVRNQTKIKYQSLNTRQISDAVKQAQGLYDRVKDKKIVFGGRKNWNKLVGDELSQKEWKDKRDNQIYARGDKTKKGNPNLRLINKGGDFYLRVTIGNRKFEEYKLFIPIKFQEKLFSLFGADIFYNARLLKKDEQHYRVVIDYEIGCIVKQIINYAIENNKGMIFENLKFKKEFENQGREFNRVKSNFVWKKILGLLERKCIENGIMYRKVNSAFTSAIGNLKYQNMYNLSIHESASYVIGRRGLNLNEKLSLYKYPSNCVKELVLDLAGDRTKRIYSWGLWRKLRDNRKAVLTGLQSRMSNLKELDGNLCNIGENPIGEIFRKELVSGSLTG